jgi:HPt (histidine-containing phosphotransfer) domain-containing protein
LKHFPRDQNEALWSRFKTANQSFFDRRSAHFDELDQQRENNQARAMQLIKKAKSCAGKSDLRQAREEIKQLQQEWKQVHPLPREQADDLWSEFRSTCQTVFDN